MAALNDQALLNQMAAQAFEPFNNFLAARLGMAQRGANERFVLSRDEAEGRRAGERAIKLQESYLDRLEKSDKLRREREVEQRKINTEDYKALMRKEDQLTKQIQDAYEVPTNLKNRRTRQTLDILAERKGIDRKILDLHFDPASKYDITSNLPKIIKNKWFGKDITPADVEEVQETVDKLIARDMLPKLAMAKNVERQLLQVQRGLNDLSGKVDLRGMFDEPEKTPPVRETTTSQVPSDDDVELVFRSPTTAQPATPTVIPARSPTVDVPFAERGLFGVTEEGGAARPVLQTIGNLLDVRPGLRSIGEPITEALTQPANLAQEFGTRAGRFMFGRGPVPPSTTVPASQFIIPMNQARSPLSDQNFSLTPEAIRERAKSFTAADASKLRQIAKDEGLSDMQIDSMMQRVVQRDPAALEFIQHLSAKLIQMESQPTFNRRGLTFP